MSVTAASDDAFDADAEIGARVHQAMFRARMSQTRMAPLIGVNQSVLSRKLRGVVSWSALDVMRASLALSVPLAELMPPPEMCAARDSNPEPADSESADFTAPVIPLHTRRTRRTADRRRPAFTPFPLVVGASS